MAIKKPSKVTFVDERIEKIFFELNESDEIKRFIYRAIEDIKENAFCGIQIPKRLIPKNIFKDMGLLIYGSMICQMVGD